MAIILKADGQLKTNSGATNPYVGIGSILNSIDSSIKNVFDPLAEMNKSNGIEMKDANTAVLARDVLAGKKIDFSSLDPTLFNGKTLTDTIMKKQENDADNIYRSNMLAKQTEQMRLQAEGRKQAAEYAQQNTIANQEYKISQSNKPTMATIETGKIDMNKATIAAVTKYATEYKDNPDGAIAKIAELRGTGTAPNAAIADGLEKKYNENAATTKTNKVAEVTTIIEDLSSNNPTVKNKATEDAKKLGIVAKPAATPEVLAQAETDFAAAYPESSNKNWLGDLVGLKPTAQETIDAMVKKSGIVGKVSVKEKRAIYKKFMIERFNRAAENATTEAEVDNIRKEKEIYLFNFNKGTAKDAASIYKKNEVRKNTNLIY